LSVVASGTAPLAYQWQKNGTNIPGATGPSFTTPPTTLADNNASFKVTVTNGAGTATSTAAILSVNPASGGGGPTTVTLQQGLNGYSGTVDTYLDQFQPTTSFGTLDRVEVRYYDPGTGLQEHMITLLQFDLSSIPSSSTVTGATLRLYNLRAAANDASDVMSLDKILSAWNDSWTWAMGIPSTAPSGVTCPSVAGYSLAPTTPELYTITGLGPLVQGWVTTPSSNHGLMLSTTSNLNMRFASSEYAGAQYRPALEITTTSSGGGTPPTVTVSSPPTTTNTSPLVVSGTASGSSSITQVTWSNAATGASGTATGTASWTATIPLAPGTNTITITAADSSGNTNTSTFTVNNTGSGSAPASAASSSGGGGSHKVCGMGAAGDLPTSFLLHALALSAILIWTTRRRARGI
jgi:hypothetical protein